VEPRGGSLNTTHGNDRGQYPYLCFLAELGCKSLQALSRAETMSEMHFLEEEREFGSEKSLCGMRVCCFLNEWGPQVPMRTWPHFSQCHHCSLGSSKGLHRMGPPLASDSTPDSTSSNLIAAVHLINWFRRRLHHTTGHTILQHDSGLSSMSTDRFYC
jgi:hypothetical protein